MKKTISFGILTIGFVMIVGMIRSKHNGEQKKTFAKQCIVFDSINDNPIGI